MHSSVVGTADSVLIREVLLMSLMCPLKRGSAVFIL